MLGETRLGDMGPEDVSFESRDVSIESLEIGRGDNAAEIGVPECLRLLISEVI